MAIRVEGIDTNAAMQRAHHHAPGVLHLLGALAVGLLLESPLARDEHIHVLRQHSNGGNSYALHLADGRQMHLRAVPMHSRDYDVIVVYDRWFHGQQAKHRVALIETVEDARAWVGSLRYEDPGQSAAA
jgi:hypothetical protein